MILDGYQVQISLILSPSLQSLSKSKELLRGVNREKLEEVNLVECELLEERLLSEECKTAVISFMRRKMKS